MPTFIPSTSLADFYRGILKPGPQGGIYAPGPPVMLPPQGFRSQFDPTGDGPNYGMLDDQLSGGMYPIRSMAQIGGYPAPGYGGGPDSSAQTMAEQRQGYVPGPNGYTVANKDQSQLQSGNPANAFAYDQGPPQSPGLAAITGSMMPPMPIPRPAPPAVFGSGEHGEIRRGSDGNYYQYVQMSGGNYGAGDASGPARWTWERTDQPGGVDWSQMAPDGMRPDGTYGGPQTGFTPDPANIITVNGGSRMPMGAPKPPRPRAVPQGPGANGRPGAGNIKNNPTKYGRTQQDRNDYQNARQAFLASWGVT